MHLPKRPTPQSKKTVIQLDKYFLFKELADLLQCTQKQATNPILVQMNSVHALIFHSFNTHCNTLLLLGFMVTIMCALITSPGPTPLLGFVTLIIFANDDKL
jgi:hypothetical protein